MQNFWVRYKINQIKPQSITVDLFDTLLYRKPEPELYRFYILSKMFSKEFVKAGFYTTPYFLFLQRNYFTTILRHANTNRGLDHETTHTQIYKSIVEDLCRRQNIKLSTKDIDKLLTKLLDIELEYEHSQLKPSKSLLNILKNAKISGTKIYYVTDMYLESKQIDVLLSRLKINIFSGGISSADKLLGKSSGRSFDQLNNKYKSIDLSQSLHIGDNHRSDVRIPKQFGLQTIWYFAPIHKLVLFIYKIVFKIYFGFISAVGNKKLREQQSSILKTLFSEGPMTTKKEAEYIGWLFAPAIIYYLHQLGTTTDVGNSKTVFVTGESEQLSRFYNKLGFSNDAKLINLNRTKLIRAYSSILIKKGLELSSIVSFTKKILRRKSARRALATLGITRQSSHQFLLLGKDSLSKSKINKLDINRAQQLWDNDLKDVIKSWKQIPVSKQKSSVTLADIGWNDTIQILLHEILLESNNGIKNINGMYLGRTGTNIFHPDISTNSLGVIFDSLKQKNSKYFYQPEVWESFLNLDNVNNTTRENIIAGINQAIGYFNLSPQTADMFWSNNKSRLLKILRHPTNRMIEVMSNLQFDYGTVDEPICPLVNVSARKPQVFKWLITDRAKFKSFYFHQGWKWGAATYYRFRLPYRIWRIKSKKPSF